MIRIVPMSGENLPDAVQAALQLWPEHSAAGLEEEFSDLLNNRNAAVFLAYSETGTAGFAQCGLRSDYVEGTHSSPVGYLEGIFVREDLRRQGIASALLNECRLWCRRMGCTEFASDCELSNGDNLQFHLHSGFAEANRIICFVQEL